MTADSYVLAAQLAPRITYICRVSNYDGSNIFPWQQLADSCMADSGFTTSSPDNVQSDLGLEQGELSSPEAITIAKADVACKTQVNYIGIRYAVQSAYEKLLVEEHAETLALFQQQTQDRIRLAAQLNG